MSTSASLFGMVASLSNAAGFPSVPFGGLRLWDTLVTWKDIDSGNCAFNWTVLDKQLAIAAANSKEVLYTFGKVPTWAGGGAGFNNPPTDIATGNYAFKTFVANLVLHSLTSTTAKIAAYELWNEPNLPMYWTGTPAQLLEMTRDAYAIIKLLDPTAIVIGPAGNGGSAMNSFILSYYTAAGANIPQDVFSYHAYIGDGQRNAMGLATLLQNIKYKMGTFGMSKMPIWFTEGSWGQTGAYTPPLTDAEQVAYMAVQYLLMWYNGVQRYYWYAWDNNSGWGPLWDAKAGVHPVGVAFGQLYTWLVGSICGTTLTENTSGTWTLPLTMSDGTAAQIVWNANVHSLATTAKHYMALDSNKVYPVTNGSVTVKPQPILLLQR